MQEEIYRLYVQKTGTEPKGELEEFIRGLTVREVARIWSLMGDGGDFIAALQKVVKLKISKVAAGTDGATAEFDDSDLDSMVKHLKEQQEKAKKDQEDAAKRAAKAEEERKAAREKLKQETEAAAAAEEARRQAKEKADEEKAAAEKAAQAKIEADMRAAEAAEKERKAAETAAAAAAEERQAAEEAMRQAQEELEKMKKQAAEAESARLEAEAKAKSEQEEAIRKEALEMAARERAEEQRQEAARIEKEKREAEQAHREAEKKAEEEEEEEELKEETITITLTDSKEPLGLDCLAGGGRVRIIDVSGACERAAVKSASVLLKVDGCEVDSQETLIESVKTVRESGKLSFDIVVLPPPMVSAEDHDILHQYHKHKEEIAHWKGMVEKCSEVKIEMKVLQALDLLDKGSQKPFCEVKLREVVNGKVGSGHKHPQKVVTKVVSCTSAKGKLSNAVWDELFSFESPKTDCIRVSLFGNKVIGKEYLGRVDLVLPELLEDLCSGPIIARWPIQGEEGRGPVNGELELAVNLAACDKDDGSSFYKEREEQEKQAGAD